jgi:hypothetical protein
MASAWLLTCGIFAMSALTGQGAVQVGASTPLGATLLGVYTGTGNASDVKTFEKVVGTKIQWAMQFDTAASWDLLASYKPPESSGWGASRYHMVWGIPMLPSGKPNGDGHGPPCCGATLAIEATGAYNAYFAQFGAALVAHRQSDAVLRIGPEFNGTWNAWSALGQIHNFIAAYRQVVQAFRFVPGNHFTFDWNPNMFTVAAGDPGSYYPGDSYVNYVGFDVYDVAWKHYPGSHVEWKNLETETYGLDWLSAFAQKHHKPMTFPEWGLGWGLANAGRPVSGAGATQGGDDGYFVTQMESWCRFHKVAFAIYYEPTGSVSRGWNPNAAKALRRSWG